MLRAERMSNSLDTIHAGIPTKIDDLSKFVYVEWDSLKHEYPVMIIDFRKEEVA